ncbi:helix-turn-helix transcriptional regulator [Pelagibius sp.]|uniref:helix-turn-helix transcriptional regulator n=1 Tax=Pelagibius sp. TaxID=1931238 RepID=UPI00260F0D95|nr:helix-turn-helix transcriptional regulator [Pelagibius sp.]
MKKSRSGRSSKPATARSGSTKARDVKTIAGSAMTISKSSRNTEAFVPISKQARQGTRVIETVTLPRADFDALVEAAEDNKSRRAYEATRDEETFPAEVVNAILDGENAVKVWRVYRGLKQTELAKGIGISKSHLSEVESGKANLSVPVLSELANALEVDMEMLVPATR